jgi:acyl-coenzyme A thioesterase PaaI-like protein
MAENAETRSSEPGHMLIQRALTSRVPIAKFIGFRVEEIGDWRTVVSLQSGPQHANPMGTLYGGVLCDLADAAMGLAVVTTLALDESCAAIEGLETTRACFAIRSATAEIKPALSPILKQRNSSGYDLRINVESFRDDQDGQQPCSGSKAQYRKLPSRPSPAKTTN